MTLPIDIFLIHADADAGFAKSLLDSLTQNHLIAVSSDHLRLPGGSDAKPLIEASRVVVALWTPDTSAFATALAEARACRDVQQSGGQTRFVAVDMGGADTLPVDLKLVPGLELDTGVSDASLDTLTDLCTKLAQNTPGFMPRNLSQDLPALQRDCARYQAAATLGIQSGFERYLRLQGDGLFADALRAKGYDSRSGTVLDVLTQPRNLGFAAIILLLSGIVIGAGFHEVNRTQIPELARTQAALASAEAEIVRLEKQATLLRQSVVAHRRASQREKRENDTLRRRLGQPEIGEVVVDKSAATPGEPCPKKVPNGIWVGEVCANSATVILSAARTGLTTLEGIESFKALRILRAHSNPITDLTPLAALPKLTEISVWNTSVTDLSPLANTLDLNALSLYRTKVSDLTPLRNLTDLRKLELAETPVSDISALRNLTKLQRLTLSGTDVSDIAVLSRMIHLTHLSLKDTKVTDLSPLRPLNSLSWLLLPDGTQVTGRNAIRSAIARH